MSQVKSPEDRARRNLVDLAYSEFNHLEKQGQAVSNSDYVAQHPDIASSLMRVLQVHLDIHDNPDFKKKPKVAWPAAGDAFLGFQLERELGRGTYSRVFLASEPALGDRRVVVKLSQHAASEAHIQGRLNHPNIGPVHSITHHAESDLAAICMPYLGDATFDDLLEIIQGEQALPERGSVILDAAVANDDDPLLPTTHAAGAPAASSSAAFLNRASYVDGVRLLARQILDALAFMHGKGIIHRDLKPSNVLLTRDGVPMLLDFNLAEDMHSVDGRIGGTLVYMAPEQLTALVSKKPAALDGRADLFALGVIFYELLIGRHPFGPPAANTPLPELRQELMRRHQAGARPVRELNPTIDAALAAIVDGCLAFDPLRRPASAAAALAQLATCVPAPAAAVPAPAPLQRHERSPRSVLRRAHGWPMVLACAALIGGIGWMGSWTIMPARVSDWQQAETAERMGDHALAVACLTRHLETHKEDASAWYVRGVAQLKLADNDPAHFPLAIMDFDTADRLAPSGRAKAQRGYALHRSGQKEYACLAYERALKADFATAELLNNLGVLCTQISSRQDDAEGCFNRALALDGQFQAAYHNRGRFFLVKATPLRAAAAREPASFENASMLRHLLERCVTDLTKAIELGPISGELYFDAALACAMSAPFDDGLKPMALDYLRRAAAHGCDPRRFSRAPFTPLLSDVSDFRTVCSQTHTPRATMNAHCVVAIPVH